MGLYNIGTLGRLASNIQKIRELRNLTKQGEPHPSSIHVVSSKKGFWSGYGHLPFSNCITSNKVE